MIDGGLAEWAVITHDGIGQAGNPAMSGESLCRQRMGHRLHGRAQRSRRVTGRHLQGKRLAVLRADLVGDPLGLSRVDDGQKAAQQREEKVVADRRHRGGGVGPAGEVALRRAPDPSVAAVDVNVEVSACCKLVEVVAGDVWVEGETLGHLGRGDAMALSCEQIDLSSSTVTEGRGDRGHCRRKALVGARWFLRRAGAFFHTVMVPVAAASTTPGSTKDANDKTPVWPMTDPDKPLEQAVGAVVDPGLFHSISDLGLLRSVKAHRGRTQVVIAVPAAGHPAQRELADEVAKAVAAAGGAPAELKFVNLTQAEEAELRARLYELGRAPQRPAGNAPAGSHGHDRAGADAGAGPGGDGHRGEGPAPRGNPFAHKASRTRVLAVSSGKGGVGKSTVTVNLAVALAQRGLSVAILDADVYGFSVPSMLGVDRPPVVLGDLLIPPVAHGVRCISMGFFVDEDQAVMWRGPMLHKALEQFLVDVHWGNPEFLLLDLPPGTGDVAMSIAQFVPRAEVLVVTTPQASAERVAQRSAVLARQLRLPVRGVVENQSWFTGDDGKRYELFGHGGGEQLAKSLGVTLLAQIPFLPTLRQAGDLGVPVAAFDPEGEAGRAFALLAERVVALGPGRVYRSELSVD